jgi:formylglycine-generating enzyme required for sulfatase activity
MDDAGAAATPMVSITPASAPVFGIDVTEVTFRQYAAFPKATGGKPSSPVAGCGFKTSHVPEDSCFAPLRSDPSCSRKPQTCVDWCDAAAYCAWVGKRLCRVSSGPVVDEWYLACSGNGAHAYPWGEFSEEKDAQCATATRIINGCPDCSLEPVGTLRECHGAPPAPFEQIFDLAGNASELVDSCTSAEGPGDSCPAHGSNVVAGGGASNCKSGPLAVRSDRSAFLGFRCCGDG